MNFGHERIRTSDEHEMSHMPSSSPPPPSAPPPPAARRDSPAAARPARLSAFFSAEFADLAERSLLPRSARPSIGASAGETFGDGAGRLAGDGAGDCAGDADSLRIPSSGRTGSAKLLFPAFPLMSSAFQPKRIAATCEGETTPVTKLRQRQ